MGGNALKVPTRRYERTEFEEISKELLDTLSKTFKRAEMPLYYKNKPSFGDADILISTDGYNGNIRDYITDTFKPNEIVHNGNCYSFDYKEIQVDLITVSGERFDTNIFYLSFNDMGNFIGKIAHGFGLKYGQDGLTYDHNFKGSNIGRVFISKDYKKIFEFLDLSYDRYLQGFDELVDIFKFITASKYFNWEYVQLENNNKINRDRDKKRKSYNAFLEYIDNNVRDDIHKYEYFKDKSDYIPMINEFFPEANLELEIRRLEYEHCRSLYIKAKFNGGDVMRNYGFKGKELGDVLTGFKEFINNRFSNELAYDKLMIINTKGIIYQFFELYLNTNNIKYEKN